MAKQPITDLDQHINTDGVMPYNPPQGEYLHQLELPARVYEQLSDISEKSGVSMDDLLIASADIFFRRPTQSLMRRVLRKAQEYRVERILQAFPAPVKRAKTDGE